MKYNIIFYLSKKTSYCEKALKKAFFSIGGEAHRVSSATTPIQLGEEVARSLKICPLTVIIGGLHTDGDDNLSTVLSRVFSNSSLTLENMRKLSGDSGSEGYIVRYKSQILLALPDSPADITSMCSENLLDFIREKVTVSENGCGKA
ncbi:MAG: hypothetical protein IJV48_02160 [Ruminococcus sp.]|nr:hypothetical protein [Ruminococcus sp.]